jgi:hypothetical protein
MMARVRWRSVGKGASGDASWEGAGGGLLFIRYLLRHACVMPTPVYRIQHPFMWNVVRSATSLQSDFNGCDTFESSFSVKFKILK